MHLILLIGSILTLALSAFAAEPEYPREVAKWQEVSVPPESPQGAYQVWSSAAIESRNEWRVYTERGQICAQLITAKLLKQRKRPKFTPKVGQFRGASSELVRKNGARAIVSLKRVNLG